MMNPIKATQNQILCAISLLVVFANVLEIIVLVRTKRRWYNAQVLLLNLAIADSALGLATLIWTSFWLSNMDYRTDSTEDLRTLAFFGGMYGSLLIMVLISVDRWFAVRWPLKYHVLMTRKRLYIGILLSWVLAALIVTGTVVLNSFSDGYGWFYIGGPVVIIEPFILVYLYSSIFVHYRKSARKTITNYSSTRYLKSKVDGSTLSVSSVGPPENAIVEGKQITPDIRIRQMQMSGKESRLLRFCFVIAICFCVSYMPAGITLQVVRIPSQMPPWLGAFIVINGFCGSLWNPILYFLYHYAGGKTILCKKSNWKLEKGS